MSKVSLGSLSEYETIILLLGLICGKLGIRANDINDAAKHACDLKATSPEPNVDDLEGK